MNDSLMKPPIHWLLLVNWLGEVFDSADLYYVGRLICGPDANGSYRVTYLGDLRTATDVRIQRVKHGAYDYLGVL